MVLVNILKEEILLINAIINLMILFICQKFPRCNSNSHFIKFSSVNCNYCKRGGYECPLYDSKNYKLHLPTVDMYWYTPLDVIHSYIKSQCIGGKLDFDITCCILYDVHYYTLNY
jgi:hypothetical protein